MRLFVLTLILLSSCRMAEITPTAGWWYHREDAGDQEDQSPNDLSVTLATIQADGTPLDAGEITTVSSDTGTSEESEWDGGVGWDTQRSAVMIEFEPTGTIQQADLYFYGEFGRGYAGLFGDTWFSGEGRPYAWNFTTEQWVEWDSWSETGDEYTGGLPNLTDYISGGKLYTLFWDYGGAYGTYPYQGYHLTRVELALAKTILTLSSKKAAPWWFK